MKGEQSKEEWTLYKTKGPNYGKNAVVLSGGEAPKQGFRSDLKDTTDIINFIKDKDQMANMRTLSQHCSSRAKLSLAENLFKYHEQKRNWKPTVYWLFGETNAGKTRWAHENFPDAWISGRNLKWWEGYDAHENVIIDDFREDFCSFHELLRILDRYEYRIEVKGSSRQLLAKNIIITSPFPPENSYHCNENIDQLLRRIDHILEFKLLNGETQITAQRCAQKLPKGNTVSKDSLITLGNNLATGGADAPPVAQSPATFAGIVPSKNPNIKLTMKIQK